MSLRYHHGCHRSAHSSGSLLSGTEGQIHGAAQLSYLIMWQALTLIKVFQQISLVHLKLFHSVQRSERLTCCCIRLSIYARCILKGLNSKFPWRGSIAPNAGVWVVVNYFVVIAMYSKYKRVLSINVISGKIIHCFIISLKEGERPWRAKMRRFKFAHTMNDIGSEAD